MSASGPCSEMCENAFTVLFAKFTVRVRKRGAVCKITILPKKIMREMYKNVLFPTL